MALLEIAQPFMDSLTFSVYQNSNELNVDPETGNYVQRTREIAVKALIKPSGSVGSLPIDRTGYDPIAIAFEGWLIDPTEMPVIINYPFNTVGIWKNKKISIVLLPMLQKSQYVLQYTGECIRGSLYI